MLISVIIPNFNYARYLPRAIESVLAQTYREVEIVVVDDGSTDNSLDILCSYGSRVQVVQQQNKGVSAARNCGVRKSRGDWIAFLDADDSWDPIKLERQMELASRADRPGLIHCGLREVDADGQVKRLRIDGMSGEPIRLALEMLLFRRTVVLGAGSSAILPRRVIEQLGGFDTRLSTSADWDLCFRVALTERIEFVPAPLVDYLFHDANMHGNIRRMEHDMLLAYEKAFIGTCDPQIRRVRRRAYANLHMVLAGSYFAAHDPKSSLRHAAKALRLNPSSAGRLLGYPGRLVCRALRA